MWIEVTLDDGRPGYRCERAGHPSDPFPRGEICHHCVTDPGEVVAEDEVDEREVAALRARVNEYRSNSRACVRRSNELAEDGTAQDGHLAVKYQDAAVKWARLAEDRQDKLDEYVREDRLMRHESEMNNRGTSH